jgi:hypothetical protein
MGGTGNHGGMTSGTAGEGAIAGMAGMAGSPSPTCGATFAVAGGGYVTGPGSSGCWHGYAFTAASSASTLSPMTFAGCASPCSLCMTGSVAASVDFSEFAAIGFNLNQAVDQTGSGTVIPAGSSLVVNFTNFSSAPLRVEIDGQNGGTVAAERWCVELGTVATGPISVPYSLFNTQCWLGGSGTPYARQPIRNVHLIVPGSNTTSTPFTVCLTGVSDG